MHLSPGQQADLEQKLVEQQPKEEKLQLQPASEQWASEHNLLPYLPIGLGWTGWFAITNKIGWYYCEYKFWIGTKPVAAKLQVPHNIEITDLVKQMSELYSQFVAMSIISAASN